MGERNIETNYVNAYTSAYEVFLFGRDKPERVFCYPSSEGYATTWTGERLSRHKLAFGARYKDNFGGCREAVSFVGINGYWYHGTRFSGSGDYIRAKRGKIVGHEYLTDVRKIEAHCVITRAIHERGLVQEQALDELARRGLWLSEEQAMRAGVSRKRAGLGE